jgi:transposase
VTAAVLGLDVGDRFTHFCVLDGAREVVERGRFATRPDAVRMALGNRRPCHVVLEAGSQSPWLSALLRDLGHRVQVADPRRVELITKSHRKTDRRDAETLARLALGMPELLGDVCHRSSEHQAALAIVRSRDLLVRMRTKCVQHVRGTCKAFGLRLGSCSTRSFHHRVREEIPEQLRQALEPILTSLSDLEARIRDLERRMSELAERRYPQTNVLRRVNGVGPVTSLAFVLTIADPTRFKKSRDVGSWIGLCPRVRASGDQDPHLSISKTGDGYLRRLLVQSAQYILGPFGKDSDLRRFGERLCARGGKAAKRRAVVAVARKLAVLLHRLWVTGEVYEPLRQAQRNEKIAAS